MCVCVFAWMNCPEVRPEGLRGWRAIQVGQGVPQVGQPCGPTACGGTGENRARWNNAIHPCVKTGDTACDGVAMGDWLCGRCYGPCVVVGIWLKAADGVSPVVCANPTALGNCDQLMDGSSHAVNKTVYICTPHDASGPCLCTHAEPEANAICDQGIPKATPVYKPCP